MVTRATKFTKKSKKTLNEITNKFKSSLDFVIAEYYTEFKNFSSSDKKILELFSKDKIEANPFAEELKNDNYLNDLVEVNEVLFGGDIDSTVSNKRQRITYSTIKRLSGYNHNISKNFIGSFSSYSNLVKTYRELEKRISESIVTYTKQIASKKKISPKKVSLNKDLRKEVLRRVFSDNKDSFLLVNYMRKQMDEVDKTMNWYGNHSHNYKSDKPSHDFERKKTEFSEALKPLYYGDTNQSFEKSTDTKKTYFFKNSIKTLEEISNDFENSIVNYVPAGYSVKYENFSSSDKKILELFSKDKIEANPFAQELKNDNYLKNLKQIGNLESEVLSEGEVNSTVSNKSKNITELTIVDLSKYNHNISKNFIKALDGYSSLVEKYDKFTQKISELIIGYTKQVAFGENKSPKKVSLDKDLRKEVLRRVFSDNKDYFLLFNYMGNQINQVNETMTKQYNHAHSYKPVSVLDFERKKIEPVKVLKSLYDDTKNLVREKLPIISKNWKNIFKM